MSPSKDLTTREYAKRMGISASTVAKWLRSGKLKGKKQDGKWVIPADAPASETPHSTCTPESTPPKSEKKTAAPLSVDQFYSVEKFSEMTYLTVFGVTKWLKEGRLIGVKDSSGRLQVSAESLKFGHVQRLLRN